MTFGIKITNIGINKRYNLNQNLQILTVRSVDRIVYDTILINVLWMIVWSLFNFIL